LAAYLTSYRPRIGELHIYPIYLKKSAHMLFELLSLPKWRKKTPWSRNSVAFRIILSNLFTTENKFFIYLFSWFTSGTIEYSISKGRVDTEEYLIMLNTHKSSSKVGHYLRHYSLVIVREIIWTCFTSIYAREIASKWRNL
jgi:hypothetical protein